ncbi:MAG: hypothetical protein ACLQQ4_01455 [Bacteroidia bacterium]
MKKLTIMMAVLAAFAFSTTWGQKAQPAGQKSQPGNGTYPTETQLQKDRINYYNTANSLREAWWMMEPNPKAGNEQSAENRTSNGYEAIQKAGVNYSSKLNTAPPAASNEIKDHKKRWEKALQFLNAAKAEIEKGDPKFSPGLKESVLKNINEAIEFANKVIAEAK